MQTPRVSRSNILFFEECLLKTIVPLGILTVVLLAGCGGEKKAVEVPPPVVTVTAAEQREVKDWDEYTGRLAPFGTVEVRPKVSGYLTEVKFDDGDMVKKGQLLFVIDPRPYQADQDRAQGEYDQADASLKLATAEYDRAKQLREKGTTSAGDFDKSSASFLKAQGALLTARAALERAKLDLEFCRITSPIDGHASLANITVGNLVSPQIEKPLTTIVSMNPVYAYADVDERSLLRYVRFYYAFQKVAPGDEDKVKLPIELSLQDEKDFSHTGYVDFLDNKVDPETGTIRIRGVFDFENGLLTPGLFVRLRIPAGAPYQAVLVPQRSVISMQGEKMVVVVGKDNTAVFRPVELGTLNGGMQVIRKGLTAGEQVVVDGLLKVRLGEKVDPKLIPIADQAAQQNSAQ
ncbi:MAG TPA: efflux RND transporter periplasmic adaptor subunit [Candidatus Udaeobacter sp.]|nr:efflux RND transporter periplasmic adaptor subunit [Candidatus Udaeobacter sp.]